MVTGPTDLPDRREPDGDAEIVYSSSFDSDLAQLIPDAVQRAYFMRDGIEFRLHRAIELQRITDVEGYLITEDGLAGVPACIIWFSIVELPDSPARYIIESAAPVEPPLEEEDDT